MPEGTRSDSQLPTVMTVPCFSGAPWDLEKLDPLSDLPLKTMRLPESVDDVEQYADFVERQIADLGCYVLVGDSFGAVVSLAFATRQPSGLRALVLSGGFAANPVRNPLLKARIRAARFFQGPLYRWITRLPWPRHSIPRARFLGLKRRADSSSRRTRRTPATSLEPKRFLMWTISID